MVKMLGWLQNVGALKHEMDINLKYLPRVIYSWFVLRNFCEMRRGTIPDEIIQSSTTSDKEIQPGLSGNRYTHSH